MITIITFIIVLGIMVLVHELGHFIIAKRIGVKVLEFSLGMGPKLVGKKWGETEYQRIKLVGKKWGETERIRDSHLFGVCLFWANSICA